MSKNKLLSLLLLSISLILSLILLKKFNKYYSENDFAKILILIILIINFLFGLIYRNFLKISLISFFYFVFTLYSVNGLLVYFDLQNSTEKKIQKILNSSSKKFDKRKILEVVKDERNQGKDIYPYVVPRQFLKENTETIPLTPLPNTFYVSCNEYGEWKKIKTDKFGLNNKNFLRSFDLLLMGDSFAEGSCVNQEYEPANLLKKKYNLKTYNIGISGNGPLLSLALAHEIKTLTDFNYIVWLIYDNDFYDVHLELKSKYLKNYLEKNFNNNNYFSLLHQSTEFQKEYIEENMNSFKRGFSLKESILELKPLIYRINKLLSQKKSDEVFEYNKNIFNKIFNKIVYLYPEKKIFVVYLPETTCFKYRSIECSQRFDEMKSFSDKIIFLNFFDHVKKNFKDYKKIYALGMDRSHFSHEGYAELVKFIYNTIQE